MRAVNNYIIVIPIKEEIKTDFGFVMQDDGKEIRYLKGEVVSCGEKTECISPKDIIYYDRHAGHNVSFEGKDHTVIKQQDVVIVE